jgi:hypothetical protein
MSLWDNEIKYDRNECPEGEPVGILTPFNFVMTLDNRNLFTKIREFEDISRIDVSLKNFDEES